MTAKVKLERQNRLYSAFRAEKEKLGRSLTPEEESAIRAEIDQQLEIEGSGNGYHEISQKDLFKLQLKPLEFVIAGLLVYPGLCLFSGKKKHLKSLLALLMALAVADGAEFLGKDTKQGAVLVISLEDGLHRLRERLQKLEANPNLPIIYKTEIQPLNSEAGMAELESMLERHQPKLTIIDTLASATSKELDENRAGDMASLMNQLHAMALNHNTTILVIAHHGKKSYNDPGFDARGSSATPSATDANLSIYKAGDGYYDLKCEGRDLPDSELRLYFNPDSFRFELKGDARDERRAIAEDKVIEAIEALGGEADAAMIATELDLTRMAVQHTCQRMRKDKLLDFKLVPSGKTKKIIYSLPETGISTLSTLSPIITEKDDNEVNKGNDNNNVITNNTENNTDNKDNKDTPISEVKEPEKESKSLGIESKDSNWPDCLKADGICRNLQRRYSKSFACNDTPAQCVFFKVKQ